MSNNCKYKTKFLFILLLLLSCSTNQENSFTIHGNIDGLKSGKAVLSKLDLDTNQKVSVDSSQINNGFFSFSGNVNSPYLHSIFLNDSLGPIHLFLENSDIHITGVVNSLENVTISGSREDSLFHSISLDAIFEKETGRNLMLTKK